MPAADAPLSFSCANDLAQWLETHHASETALWVKLFKKKTGIASITWDELVVECLCWGWIDGLKKSLDEQAYLQRITPRQARSSWSKRNRAHAERLIDAGRMQAAGLIQVQAAQADGRWQNAYAVSEMTVPADFIEALKDNPEAQAFFDTLNKSSRYVIAHGLGSAKKPETRLRRFTRFMDTLARQEKPR